MQHAAPILAAFVAAETPPAGGGGGVDIVTIALVAVLAAGILAAAMLLGIARVAHTWYTDLSNTDRQMLVNGLMIGATFLIIGGYAALEPFRLNTAAARQQHEASHKGLLHYSQYCVGCHGLTGAGAPVPAGQVVGASTFAPGLNRPDFRPATSEEMAQRAEFIRKTIERGRPGTSMPAWALEEGGALNDQEIEELVTFIQHGEWSQVSAKVSPSARATIAATQPTVLKPLPEGPGKELMTSKGCVGCHIIGGVGGTTGPALDGFSTRPQIAGVLANNDENLRRWLANPPAIKPGTLMPNPNLSPQEFRDLIEFLRKLD